MAFFPRPVGRLLVAAVFFAALACVSGAPANYVFLALSTCALAAAGAVSLAAQWAAAVPAPAGLPALDPAQALAEQLRGLRRRHIQQVDRALDAGRPDLARALGDAYTDEALKLLTGH